MLNRFVIGFLLIFLDFCLICGAVRFKFLKLVAILEVFVVDILWVLVDLLVYSSSFFLFDGLVCICAPLMCFVLIILLIETPLMC